MYGGLTWIDGLVVGGYLVAVLALGLRGARWGGTRESFLMGGRRYRGPGLSLYILASGTPSQKFGSVASRCFQGGLAAIWYELLWLVTLPFMWVIVPVYRRLRIVSMSDFFALRFGPAAEVLFAGYGLVMCTLYVAGVLTGFAFFVTALSDGRIPSEHGLAVLMAAVLIYSLAGGLRSAIVTAYLQGALILVLFGIMIPPIASAWMAAGAQDASNLLVHPAGWSLWSLILTPEQSAWLGRPFLRWDYVVMLIVVTLAGLVVSPGMINLGAARTEWDGRAAYFAGSVLKRVGSICLAFVGVACVAVYLTPERWAAISADFDGDTYKLFTGHIFARAVRELLVTTGPGLMGLVLAATLAAAMSSCDSMLVVAGGLFTQGIYRRIRPGHAGETESVHVARALGVAVMMAAWGLAFRATDLWDLLEILIATPAVLGVSFWLGLYWRRYTTPALFASSFAGYITWVALEAQPTVRVVGAWVPSLVSVIDGKLEVDDACIMAVYMSVAVVVGVVVSLVTKRPDPSRLDSFYRLVHTPVRPGERVVAPGRLPLDALPMSTARWLDHPDWEIPRPTWAGLMGFVAAWVAIGVVLLATWVVGRFMIAQSHAFMLGS